MSKKSKKGGSRQVRFVSADGIVKKQELPNGLANQVGFYTSIYKQRSCFTVRYDLKGSKETIRAKSTGLAIECTREAGSFRCTIKHTNKKRIQQQVLPFAAQLYFELFYNQARR
ncbi:MAG: hypothetical protein J6W40_02635 [Alphaproteobacteria bacterium]|nr:hypothetical protein [Alphaproteobacteria bacterium]